MTRIGQIVEKTYLPASSTMMQYQHNARPFLLEAATNSLPILPLLLSIDLTSAFMFILAENPSLSDHVNFHPISVNCWRLGHSAKCSHSTACDTLLNQLGHDWSTVLHNHVYVPVMVAPIICFISTALPTSLSEVASLRFKLSLTLH